MPKKKAADDGTTPRPRRIGVEMPDVLTEEVAAYCASRPALKESFVKDAVREAARAAAEEATVGKVAQIVAELLRA